MQYNYKLLFSIFIVQVLIFFLSHTVSRPNNIHADSNIVGMKRAHTIICLTVHLNPLEVCIRIMVQIHWIPFHENECRVRKLLLALLLRRRRSTWSAKARLSKKGPSHRSRSCCITKFSASQNMSGFPNCTMVSMVDNMEAGSSRAMDSKGSKPRICAKDGFLASGRSPSSTGSGRR